MADTNPENTQNEEIKEQQDEVTAFDVKAGAEGVDYDKLIERFGCEKITQEQIDQIERITG